MSFTPEESKVIINALPRIAVALEKIAGSLQVKALYTGRDGALPEANFAEIIASEMEWLRYELTASRRP